jgi:hypothetical protein
MSIIIQGDINMLLCPKCKAEYQEGCTVCSDCGCELIEQPEVQKVIVQEKGELKIIQFIIGVLIILGSTMFSYKLTSMYFTSSGNGQYIMEEFIWMLKAYHYSFLLAGIIICLPCIIYWCKGKKKEC